MTTFCLEAGINHFGRIKEANKILDYFLKSKFDNLTFMLHTEKFYQKHLKKNINFTLGKKFYENAIKKCRKKRKKIGMAVCSKKTFQHFSDLNFDFYKLLSVALNQSDLIKEINKKNKPIFISLGVKSSDNKIKKCLKLINDKKKVRLLHTPMTYEFNELNFERIDYLRKKFKLSVGYSNHNNDKNTLNLLSFFKPSAIFLYCKVARKKNRIYPDNDHAFFLDELDKIIENYKKYSAIFIKPKKIKKVKIFANEFKF
tara:strand:- start:26392 stop:27162 length:771 start_codon:yes stop_codon:yes gene_type:complete